MYKHTGTHTLSVWFSWFPLNSCKHFEWRGVFVLSYATDMSNEWAHYPANSMIKGPQWGCWGPLVEKLCPAILDVYHISILIQTNMIIASLTHHIYTRTNMVFIYTRLAHFAVPGNLVLYLFIYYLTWILLSRNDSCLQLLSLVRLLYVQHN